MKKKQQMPDIILVSLTIFYRHKYQLTTLSAIIIIFINKRNIVKSPTLLRRQFEVEKNDNLDSILVNNFKALPLYNIRNYTRYQVVRLAMPFNKKKLERVHAS